LRCLDQKERTSECQWVFTYKIAADSKSMLYKAQPVAKGFGQHCGKEIQLGKPLSLPKDTMLRTPM